MNWFTGRFFRCLFFPSVNIFVCITAWFQINKTTINVKKIFNLYLIMLFYGFISFGIGIGTREIAFSWRELFLTLVPFVSGRRWFVETYILLMLFAPFLNKLLHALSRKSYILLIVFQLAVFVIWPSFIPSPPIADGGLGIVNFITVYIIIGYIKLYGLKISKLICWIGLMASVLFTFAFSFLSENIWQYCFFTNITAAVFVFLIFINGKPFYNRFLNIVSSTTFGIYLIHVDWILTDLIYQKLLHCYYFCNSAFYLLHMILSILILFIIGACIDWLRGWVWRITIDKILNKIKILREGININ